MLAGTGLIALIGVADLDRAQRFYGDTLGLALRDERPFALVAEIGGAVLRITAVEEPLAAPYSVLGWRVQDITSAVDDLVSRGVPTLRYDGLAQDARGIWTTPGGVKIAWFSDPDGNVLSLTA